MFSKKSDDYYSTVESLSSKAYEMKAQLKQLRKEKEEIIQWICAQGYPYDWTSTVLPPVWAQHAIENEWVKESTDIVDAENIRQICGEEGGWRKGSYDN
jgi:hypothetical protein